MGRSTSIIVFPLANGEGETSALQAAMCRGIASYLDDRLGQLPGTTTALQHLVISPDDNESEYRWLAMGSKWTLAQVLELPIPEGLNASHLLHGEVTWNRSLWRVELELVDLESREVAWEGDVACAPADFLARFSQLLKEMSGHALGAPTIAMDRVFAGPTTSAAGFESFLMGLSLLSARKLRMPGVGAANCFEAFLQALESDPNFIEAADRLNGLAMHVLFEERTEPGTAEALDALRRAMRLAPDFAPFRASLGMWHASRGEDRVGRELLEAYVSMEDESEPLSRGLAILGTLYRRGGRPSDARTALERAVSKDAANYPAWEELASIHADDGDLDRAEHCLRQVLEYEPERPNALVNLGSIFWIRGDRERARVLFGRAHSAPDAPRDATRRYAIACMRTGDSETANEVVTEWAESDPTDPAAWILLARIRREVGDKDGVTFCLNHLETIATSDAVIAALQVEKLALASPADHDAFLLLARNGETDSDLTAEDRPPVKYEPAEREERLRALAARHPESLPIWMALVEILSSMEHWAPAASAQARVVTLLPRSAAQWNILGVLRARANAPTDGLEAFETAMRIAPDESSFHTNAAMCLVELGEVERARAEFQRAVDLGEPSPVAKLGLLRLRTTHPDGTPLSQEESDGALQRLLGVLEELRKKME